MDESAPSSDAAKEPLLCKDCSSRFCCLRKSEPPLRLLISEELEKQHSKLLEGVQQLLLDHFAGYGATSHWCPPAPNGHETAADPLAYPDTGMVSELDQIAFTLEDPPATKEMNSQGICESIADMNRPNKERGMMNVLVSEDYTEEDTAVCLSGDVSRSERSDLGRQHTLEIADMERRRFQALQEEERGDEEFPSLGQTPASGISGMLNNTLETLHLKTATEEAVPDSQQQPAPHPGFALPSAVDEQREVPVWHYLQPKQIVKHRAFEAVTAIVIMSNAVTIGVSTDYFIHNLDDSDGPDYFQYLEVVFLSFYSIEVCLRMHHEQCAYFLGAQWKWNVFDLVLVVQGMWEMLEDNVLKGEKKVNLSFLRMLRVVKMLKLLRVIRLLRVFRELRLILSSVFGCVHSMMWACLMILMLSFIFSIVFIGGVTEYLRKDPSSLDPVTQVALEKYWSSVFRGITSLYIACTGGRDWDEIAVPLKEVGVFYYALFLFYVALYSVVIVNTISSVFFEGMMNNSEKDTLATIELHMEKKEEYVAKLKHFFDAIDDNGDGLVTLDEFERHVVDDPHMLAFATCLDLDMNDIQEFFKVLSINGNRPVDLENFVVGCIKLKGKAREMDLMDLVYSHRRAILRHEGFEGLVISRLDEDLRHLVNVEKNTAVKQDRATAQQEIFARTVLHRLDGLQRLMPPAVAKNSAEKGKHSL